MSQSQQLMDTPRLYVTFHGIGPPPRALEPGEEIMWLELEMFEMMLDVIRDRADVGVTFDDGNLSDVSLALPALRRRGMTASFFVVAGRIGQAHFLGREDLQTLVREGMQIGCHGMTHRQWRHLSPDALDEELVTARAEIAEATGESIRVAACPFGAYDRRVLRALRAAGYERVYTSDRGSAGDGWLVPRNTLTANDTPETIHAMLQGWSVPWQWCASVKRWIKGLR